MGFCNSNKRTFTKGQVAEVVDDDKQKILNDNLDEDLDVYVVSENSKW